MDKFSLSQLKLVFEISIKKTKQQKVNAGDRIQEIMRQNKALKDERKLQVRFGF